MHSINLVVNNRDLARELVDQTTALSCESPLGGADVGNEGYPMLEEVPPGQALLFDSTQQLDCPTGRARVTRRYIEQLRAFANRPDNFVRVLSAAQLDSRISAQDIRAIAARLLGAEPQVDREKIADEILHGMLSGRSGSC